MAGAWPSAATGHTNAWRWLNDLDVDIALVQEAVRTDQAVAHWDSVIWSSKYGRNWGSAVLTRGMSYRAWEVPTTCPWLRAVGGAACVAEPEEPGGLWLASIHSSAGSWKETELPSLPSLDGIARCSADGSELWEIEVVAHELRDVLRDKPFIVGGDLNSSLTFDKNYGGRENEVLFANLAGSGYVDLRPRHELDEVQTYFKPGAHPYQLDHVYADTGTEVRVTSWEVLTDVAAGLGLSDHAPILITLGP